MPKPITHEQIARLETLPYDAKLRHYTNENPWEGLSLPNTTAVPRTSVNVIDGNVTRMPPLGGKPCFGNPIAWIAHGLIDTVVHKNGIGKTRCGRCKARSGCERVAEARLGISDDVRRAAQGFRDAGGARALHYGPRQEDARRALAMLVRQLGVVGPFTSINDEFAAKWADAERERKRTSDARRQREKRECDARKALKDNRIPDELMAQIDRERNFRVVRFRMLASTAGAPKSVAVDPAGTNAAFTADVWRASIVILITRAGTKRPTAYSIAKYMAAEGQTYGLGSEVLRDRVLRAMKRIVTLESTLAHDVAGAVWPVFDPKNALKELAACPLRDMQ